MHAFEWHRRFREGWESVENDKALDIRRLPALLKTSKQFPRRYILNEEQSADEVTRSKQSELKSMVKIGFQKCFDDLYQSLQMLSAKNLISKEAGGIIGPYFFKNDEGQNVTVNGDRYRAMVINFLIPELNNHHVQELRFRQDGAACHTARAILDLLKDTFSDRLISRFGPVNWPPRSCDLTPLDYFLWGSVKSLVYVDKPQTPDHLEDNIRRVIADIRPQMLDKVIENWTSRLYYIRASRGSHMPEIIFKM
ncbi:putative transposable element [Trichonephila clavipes]|nr:putative transposable element [Trichonephila clavipes]